MRSPRRETDVPPAVTKYRCPRCGHMTDGTAELKVGESAMCILCLWPRKGQSSLEGAAEIENIAKEVD